MNYFDDLVKETNNEYAGLVSEGVSAGDVTDYIDSGSYVLTHWYLAQSSVGFRRIKSLLLLVNKQQEKLSLYSAWLNPFLTAIQLVGFYTLRASQH